MSALEVSQGVEPSPFHKPGGAESTPRLYTVRAKAPSIDDLETPIASFSLAASPQPGLLSQTLSGSGPFSCPATATRAAHPQDPQELWEQLSTTQSCGVSPSGSHMMDSSRRLSSKKKRGVFIIGVAGGTASGKTTVCDRIYQRLHDDSAVTMLSQDAFYRALTQVEKEAARRQEYNFDHPSAFDEEAIVDCLLQLRAGKAVDVPIYDFSTHARARETRRVDPADVVIIEGILVLHMERIRSLLNMRIFVDTDDDVRLARRIQRDVAERGRDVAGVIEQYTKFVKPAFDTFVAPSRRHADVIIPWNAAGGNNIAAIDLITEHIRSKLGQHALRRVYPNLEVVPSTYQIRGMHTVLRDVTTPKNNFVFMADRLIRVVVECGLGHLPFHERIVTTPTGHQYVGVELSSKQLCGVSIIRSGEAMENALRACVQGVKIGKILVHRHNDDEQEDLIYQKLPSDIAERHVLLMDAMLSTGNTACRAIKTLLSKGVKEERILFLTIIAAPEGVHKVCRMFPQVKVVTSEIDDSLNDEYLVVPGCGNFGDRYFCD